MSQRTGWPKSCIKRWQMVTGMVHNSTVNDNVQELELKRRDERHKRDVQLCSRIEESI